MAWAACVTLVWFLGDDTGPGSRPVVFLCPNAMNSGPGLSLNPCWTAPRTAPLTMTGTDVAMTTFSSH